MDSDEPTVVLSEPSGATSGESLYLRIVRLVAIASNRSPTDLCPLGRTVDIEALTELFDSAAANDLQCAFTYEGFRIEIADDGTVRLLDGP